MTTSLPWKQYIDKGLGEKRKIHDVSALADLNGVIVQALRPLWVAAGRLEAGFMPPAARKQAIENPVYVCGLARAGTTLLLEALYRTGTFAAHSYRLYPYIDIPLVWERWTRLSAGKTAQKPQQRGHLDLLDVTADSPEALEEMIWMHFFTHLHDAGRSNLLGAQDRNAAFDAYYADHIRKLMHVFGRRRYLAKDNYNLTRIPYILSLFPGARFVIPVRRAESHIGSLMKQHYLFTRLEQENPRILGYMNRIGHYEFGLNRTPVNCGDGAAAAEVRNSWAAGDEVRGWALYWHMIHRYVHQSILEDAAIAAHVKIVRYEDLCAKPEESLKDVMDFCGAGWSDSAAALARTVKTPDYYDMDFSDGDRMVIRNLTGATEKLFY